MSSNQNEKHDFRNAIRTLELFVKLVTEQRLLGDDNVAMEKYHALQKALATVSKENSSS